MHRRNVGGSPAQIASAVAWLVVALGILMLLGGCTGTPKARPNRPGVATGERVLYDVQGNVIARIAFTLKNDENPDKGMGARMDKDSVVITTGGSVPFEWDTIRGEPLAWVGFSLIVIGLGVILVSKFPIAGGLVPVGVGYAAIAAGFGVFFIPFVGPAVENTLYIALPVLVIGVVWYYARKAKWFEKATSPEAQMDRVAKGDTGGAAAMAYLNSGGDKDKARKLKNGIAATMSPGSPGVTMAAVTPTGT